MNKEKKIVPELRFPEFINDGEWELEQFSKYIKLYRGSSPRPIKDFLTKDKNGINWIKIGDTKFATNFRIKEVEEKISIQGAEKSRKVKKGELILANSMSYGKTYQLTINGCIYDGWFVLRDYENFYDKEFLLQILNSSYIQHQYEKNAAGGIVQNISSEIVYRTILPQTSICEQQKIASCLSSLDDLIQAHTQKLDTLKDHKKGLMQNLFPQEGEKVPKYRFPEFENKGNWVNDVLGNRGEFMGGGTPSKSNPAFWDGDFPWISSSDISEDSIHQIWITRFITNDAIKNSATKVIPENSLLIVSRVGVGKIAITTKEISTSQDFTNFIPEKDNVEFLG